MKRTLSGGRSIELVQGDITQQDVDAIVNAANSSLLGGGGVDGAIHRAGGPAILEACKVVRAKQGPLPPGQAVPTTGGQLRARHVIHTVGPIWRGGTQAEAETLASCYRNALLVAEQLQLRSVAFPSISTGAYGYPLEAAAKLAISAVRQALAEGQHVELVRFVLFDNTAFEAFREAL
jgi:O-acetyl-ADP-ribose deacetylase